MQFKIKCAKKKKIARRKYKKLLSYVELKKLIRLIFNCTHTITPRVRYGSLNIIETAMCKTLYELFVYEIDLK